MRRAVSWNDTFELQHFMSFMTMEDIPEEAINNWFKSDIIEGEHPETLMDSILLMSAERALHALSLGDLIPKKFHNNNTINDKITSNDDSIVVSKFLDNDKAVPTIDKSTDSQGRKRTYNVQPQGKEKK